MEVDTDAVVAPSLIPPRRHRCAFGLVARSRGLIRNFQAREQGESVVGQLVHALVILGKISVYNVCPKKM